MNQFFSFKRWGLLISRHWVEHRRFFIYASLSLLGAMVITAGLWLQTTHYYNEQNFYIIYTIGIFITGAIFASLSFKMLHNKEQGMAYLTLPASRLEKLLTAILFNLILFTVVYLLCFELTHMVAMSIIKARMANPLNHVSVRLVADDPVYWNEGPKQLMYAYFGVQAMFLAGSIYFKRFHFLLTLITLVLILVLGSLYSNYLGRTLIPQEYSWAFDGAYIYKDGNRQKYQIAGVLNNVIAWLMSWGWVIGFFFVAWFRLREKEI